MQATRDFSHYVQGSADPGLSHIDLAVEGVQLRRLHVEDRARAFRAS